MTEAVVCPGCGKRMKVEVDQLGRHGPCARCGAPFTYHVADPVYGRDGKIKLACPSCGTKYRLRPEMAGRQVRCACLFKINVPGRRAAPAPRRAAGVKPPSLPPPPLDDNQTGILGRLDLDEDELDDLPEPARAAPTKKPKRKATVPADVGETGWKWWYFVLAGSLIIAFSVYQLVEGEPIIRFGGRRNGPVGGLILGTLSILIGLWSRPSSQDPS